MEGFMDMVNLKRLYLEKNLLTRLDGLDNCRSLEELYLSDQMLGEGQEFTFDEYSLAAISNSLKVLHMQDCKVKECRPLYYLEHLDLLNLKYNQISDFDDQVCPLL